MAGEQLGEVRSSSLLVASRKERLFVRGLGLGLALTQTLTLTVTSK